jgi:predicted nucleic acid-binding protein
MTGKVFADTNVLLYLLGQDEARFTLARTLLTTRPTISTQVANEFAAVAMRKCGKTRGEAVALTVALLDCCEVRPVAESTVRLGLTILGRYQLSIWDSMILAAALEAGCETLLSEDMQHGQVIDGGLTLHNPFLHGTP